MIELHEHDASLLAPLRAFGQSCQEIGGCDEELTNTTWQDAIFLSCGPGWNENDASEPLSSLDFIQFVSENGEQYGDAIWNDDIPDLAGDSSVGSHTPESPMHCLSPESDLTTDFSYGTWQPEMSLDSNLSSTLGLQSCAGILSQCSGTTNDVFTGFNDTETRKRPRSILLTDDEVDNQKDKQSSLRRHQIGAEQKPSFACPYRKLDPHRHRDCLKYTLHRIKDVKQHINRRHRIAKLPSKAAKDDHSRETRCRKSSPRPWMEGVTEEQIEKLNRIASRKISVETQWFEMWDILFPGHDRPRSAFSGNYIEEVVRLIRDCWDVKSSTFIGSAIEHHGDAGVDKDVLNRLMDTVFNRLEEEVCSPSASSDPKIGDAEQERPQRACKRSRKAVTPGDLAA